MSEPSVTVLTAVRDGAVHLRDTVQSIQEQTFTDWEYLIVDDASTDATPDLVAELARADSRIRLIRRETSGGPYAAANDGLAAARGRWVVRIDADDLAPPRRIATQVGFLQANPHLRAAAGWWRVLDEPARLDAQVRRVPATSGVLRWRLCVLGGLVHSALCIERAAMTELWGYHEAPVAQDYRLWCQLTRRGWLGVAGEVVVHWRRHPGQIGATRQALQRDHHLRILHEHLETLTGQPWTHDDVRSLWLAGRTLPVPVDQGLTALDRWEAGWRRDTLEPRERRELERLSAVLRLRHLRHRAGAQPRQAVPAALRVVTTRAWDIAGALARGRHAYR